LFIKDHSKEEADKFCNLSADIISQNPDLKKILFEKIRDACEKLVDENYNEESLLIFPTFIQTHIEYFDG